MDAVGWISAFALASIVESLLAIPGWTQVTQRASIDSSGMQANFESAQPCISADGRFVVFESFATNLVPGDTNDTRDVFLRDRQSGTTERISMAMGGVPGDSASQNAVISVDGRFVTFQSRARNLVPGDTNMTDDVFVYDRWYSTTERISVSSTGAEANGDSRKPACSANGRRVAFESSASNLVAGDTNGFVDIFVRDIPSATTDIVSIGVGGMPASSTSAHPSMSADGRFVAFYSIATNLVGHDTNDATDVFVRDLLLKTTERVSVSGTEAQGNSDSLFASISADGRWVAFESVASNLVVGDTNFTWDIFVHDRQSGTTERVSISSGSTEANDGSHSPSISADGRFVVFESDATNLVPGDVNGIRDVFVRDRNLGTTVLVSPGSGGAQSDGESRNAWISGSGSIVAFESEATDLVTSDTNSAADVFVRDLDATGFTNLCDPGVDNVIACPCANPPSAPGRGCDNSSATGGAIVSASGIAYLSMDSLMFTTSAEKPSATSIVLQGDASAANGIVFGQGVRCVGGSLERLYTKTAVAGSITAPDLGAGDPTISARSAALGDTIQAGQSRWYLVYYRDATVLGGCPSGSTFNATQTARIDWSL